MATRRKAHSKKEDNETESKVFLSGELSRALEMNVVSDRHNEKLASLFQSADGTKRISFVTAHQEKLEEKKVEGLSKLDTSFHHQQADELDSSSLSAVSDKATRHDREDSKSFTSRSYCTAHQKTKHTERDKRTVFVGNLPVATTRRTLKKLFCKYGSIEATRLRGAIAYNPKLTKRASMIRKQFHPDQESVSGYVVFKKESAANDALNSNGDVVGDRHIRVDHANREKGDYKQSVFVGNLPYVVDEEALRQLFGQCGDVRSIRVVRDKKTGVGKGFGYVHYEDKGAASLALKLHGSEFKGRAIRVFKATDTRKRKQGKKKYVHQESLKRMNKLSTKAKTDLKSSRRLAMMRNKKKTQAF